MKNFYKSFYGNPSVNSFENRVRFNGRSQSYYAIGSRCNLGRVIVVRPIRNQLHNSEINRTCIIVVKLLWKSHFVHDYGNVRSNMKTLKLFFFFKNPPLVKQFSQQSNYFLKIISHVI